MTKKILTVLTYVVLLAKAVNAQQDPQYSQYMFNQLVINPAYAGSKEAISAVVDLRQQWVSMPGAPQTGTISLHGPLVIKNIGLGAHMIYQSIGPATNMAGYIDYSYRMKIKNGKLSIGLSTGAVNYDFDPAKLEYKNSGEAYVNQYNGYKMVFDVNAGLYFNTRTFFIGASASHLTSPNLYDKKFEYFSVTGSKEISNVSFNLEPHLFLFSGKSFEVNENLVVSPSLLIKAIQSNIQKPVIDMNCNFLIKKCLWLGVTGHSNYGIGGLLQYYVNDNFKIGYCYDMDLNKMGTAGKSTHEVMLSFDFRIKKSKALSPRYLFL